MIDCERVPDRVGLCVTLVDCALVLSWVADRVDACVTLDDKVVFCDELGVAVPLPVPVGLVVNKELCDCDTDCIRLEVGVRVQVRDPDLLFVDDVV